MEKKKRQMKAYLEDPTHHVRWKHGNVWRTEPKDIPTAGGNEAFEEWLWMREVWARTAVTSTSSAFASAKCCDRPNLVPLNVFVCTRFDISDRTGLACMQ
jgi:hypothetical protein